MEATGDMMGTWEGRQNADSDQQKMIDEHKKKTEEKKISKKANEIFAEG